jgi:hypothetical protein
MSDITTACPSLTRVSIGSRAYISTVRLYSCHTCVVLCDAVVLQTNVHSVSGADVSSSTAAIA